MQRRPYCDRIEAGRYLAEQLADYAGRSDVLVLALPQGVVAQAAADIQDATAR
jgi:predicted phosphoribosyltransferase